MSQPLAKRRRTQFFVAKKIEIVAYKTDHTTATQDEIAARFVREWGKQVGRSTVSDILRDKGNSPASQKMVTHLYDSVPASFLNCYVDVVK